MVYVVVAGPADRKNVRGSARVVAKVLALDGGFNEIQGQQVAERRPHHRVIVGLARLLCAAHDRMGKACAEVLGLGGPWPVVRSRTNVGILRQQQRPSLVEVLVLRLRLVERLPPIWVTL